MPSKVFVAVIQNGRRLLGIFLRGSGRPRQVLRVGLLQKLGQGSLAGIVQIELSLVGRAGAE